MSITINTEEILKYHQIVILPSAKALTRSLKSIHSTLWRGFVGQVVSEPVGMVALDVYDHMLGRQYLYSTKCTLTISHFEV
jgi:hypothetical protein